MINGGITEQTKVLFVWLPQVSASAVAAASTKTVVVYFADAAAVADYVATAGFIGVSCRTRRQTQLSTSTKQTRVDVEY